jgi:hypothetical protein
MVQRDDRNDKQDEDDERDEDVDEFVDARAAVEGNVFVRGLFAEFGGAEEPLSLLSV